MKRYEIVYTMVCFAIVIVSAMLTLSSCSGGGGSGEATTNPSTSSAKANSTSNAQGGLSEQEIADAKKGKVLFLQLGCNTCHMNATTGKNYPDLRGLYGKTLRFKDGSTAVADDAHLAESIRYSNKRIVAGYEPAMPDFSHLKDDQVRQLVAYIKSLKDEKPEFVKPESFAE
jgi:cytochrome c2